MKKLYLVTGAFVALLGATLKSQAQNIGFPYFNNLEGATPEFTILQNAAYGGGYPGLRLTEYAQQRVGIAYLQHNFSSAQGMHIEFEYSSFGSQGGGGDGIGFFLKDASVAWPITFNTGGSLGYVGLPGGYLALGLDEYGNFKNVNDGGKNGTAAMNTAGSGGTFRDNITLRGAAGKNFAAQNPTAGSNNPNSTVDNKWGYPMLYTATTRTSTSTVGSGSTTYPPGYIFPYGVQLDPVSGNYSTQLPAGATNPYGFTTPAAGTFGASAISGNDFTIGTNNFSNWVNTSADYRKVFIDIVPQKNGSGIVTQYNISLKIQHGAIVETFLNNYPYYTTIKYADNSKTQISPTVLNLDATAPAEFQLGFLASTGGAKNAHYIHNLSVSLPNGARALPDTANTFQNTPVRLPALTNDSAYKTEGADPVTGQGGNTTFTRINIGKNSFGFNVNHNVIMNSTNTVAGSVAGNTSGYLTAAPIGNDASGTNETTEVITKYYQKDTGTWSYDSTDGNGTVTFTPLATFKGIAKILYSIKSSYYPYNDEPFRSAGVPLVVLVTPPVTAHSDSTTFSPYQNGNMNQSVTLTTLANDSAYGTSYLPAPTGSNSHTPSSSYVDPSSFEFYNGTETAPGTVVSGNTYTQPGVGTWTYNTNHTVTFAPASNFSGRAVIPYSVSGIATPYTINSTNYTLFSGDEYRSNIAYIIVNVVYSLPVTYAKELSYIVENTNDVHLYWTSASEISNKGYNIERSTDGTTWSTVGFVPSAYASGTSNTPHSYDFVDNNVQYKDVYYRLNQIDYDGQSHINKQILHVNLLQGSNRATLRLAPNPATGSVQLILDNTYSSITDGSIFDISGRVLKSFKIPANTNTFNISLSGYAPGTYIVSLIINGSLSSTKLIVK